MGDQGVLARRDCGCPLDGIGWQSIPLDNVCSFEKLTSGGMTFLDVDVIRVLEEVLPAAPSLEARPSTTSCWKRKTIRDVPVSNYWFILPWDR